MTPLQRADVLMMADAQGLLPETWGSRERDRLVRRFQQSVLEDYAHQQQQFRVLALRWHRREK